MSTTNVQMCSAYVSLQNRQIIVAFVYKGPSAVEVDGQKIRRWRNKLPKLMHSH